MRKTHYTAVLYYYDLQRSDDRILKTLFCTLYLVGQIGWQARMKFWHAYSRTERKHLQ